MNLPNKNTNVAPEHKLWLWLFRNIRNFKIVSCCFSWFSPFNGLWCALIFSNTKLEQLERLGSEDTPAASWLPIPLSHIESQVKRRQSQSYKFKEFVKISNFWISKQTLHATHLLKLLDKMCKYEMDAMSIVEDTEWTRRYRADTILSTDRFCPQRTQFCPHLLLKIQSGHDSVHRRTMWNQYTPLSTSLKRGV